MEQDASQSQTIPKEIKKQPFSSNIISLSASHVSLRGKPLLDLSPEESLIYNSLFNNLDDLSSPHKKKNKKIF